MPTRRKELESRLISLNLAREQLLNELGRENTADRPLGAREGKSVKDALATERSLKQTEQQIADVKAQLAALPPDDDGTDIK